MISITDVISLGSFTANTTTNEYVSTGTTALRFVFSGFDVGTRILKFGLHVHGDNFVDVDLTVKVYVGGINTDTYTVAVDDIKDHAYENVVEATMNHTVGTRTMFVVIVDPSAADLEVHGAYVEYDRP